MIRQIVSHGRAIWVVLLSTLVFCSVTLAAVEDRSFFMTHDKTILPIANLPVPVTSFFYAGGLISAALYAYLLLHLEKLWRMLGYSDARVMGRPLADHAPTWIVIDAALRVRDRRLRALGPQRSSRPSDMSIVSDVISFTLVWLFGLFMVGWFWWRSMPAHDLLMTGWLGVLLLVTLFFFFRSLWGAWARLGQMEPGKVWWAPFILSIPIIAGLSVFRTSYDHWQGQPRVTTFSGPTCHETEPDPSSCVDRQVVRMDFLRPAIANLREVQFTEKPRDWIQRKVAESDFRIIWCREHGLRCESPLSLEEGTFSSILEEKKFQDAWRLRWLDRLGSLQGPEIKKRDLSGANMAAAGLEGADLANINLESANLEYARLDGAHIAAAKLNGAFLNWASLENTVFFEAKMEGVQLFGARLSHSTLEGAILDRANLEYATLEGTNLRNARLHRASLDNAELKDAELTNVELKKAVLRFSNLEGANLVGADLDGADLKFVSLKKANARSARFRQADIQGADLENADLRHAILEQSNLRNARLSKANLRFARMDGADLSDAWLDGADLRNSNLERIEIRRTQMNGSNLSFSILHGTNELLIDFRFSEMNGSDFSHASLRHVDLRHVDMKRILGFRSSFGDGSVRLPPGHPRPCQWSDKVLDDAEYFGHWHGWLQSIGQHVPADIRSYPAIPPPPGCAPRFGE